MTTLKQVAFWLIQKISFNRIFWTKKNGIYLTYDDGPVEKTEELLRVLRKANAKATFFIIGENLEKASHLLKQIVADGHSIGNHTYSHYRFEGDTRAFLKELQNVQDLFGNHDMVDQKLIRIPYGIISLRLFCILLFKGYKIAFWNRDTKDFEYSKGQLSREPLDPDSIQDGDIVLMHDHTEFAIEFTQSVLKNNEAKDFFPL